MPAATDARRVTVVPKPLDPEASRQGLPAFWGVGRDHGCEKLCMYRIDVPPGAESDVHAHLGAESTICVVEADGLVVRSWPNGVGAEHVDEPLAPWTFLRIPAGVIHQAVNLGSTTAIAIVARDDPDEQEHVELYS